MLHKCTYRGRHSLEGAVPVVACAFGAIGARGGKVTC